jgi:hypothetical protein
MIVKCEIDLVSDYGERTNKVLEVTVSPFKDHLGSVMLTVGEIRHEVLLTDLETACRVMRAQGEGDE